MDSVQILAAAATATAIKTRKEREKTYTHDFFDGITHSCSSMKSMKYIHRHHLGESIWVLLNAHIKRYIAINLGFRPLAEYYCISFVTRCSVLGILGIRYSLVGICIMYNVYIVSPIWNMHIHIFVQFNHSLNNTYMYPCQILFVFCVRLAQLKRKRLKEKRRKRLKSSGKITCI